MNLSEQIKKAREESEARAKNHEARIYQSHWASAGRDIAKTTWFVAQLFMGLQWIWSRIISPIMRFYRRPLKYLIRMYINLWDWIVVRPDKYGKPTFSKVRAGVLILCTLGFFWYVLGPVIDLCMDTVLYVSTVKRDETVILVSSQEIDSKTNLHNVEGCYDLPCTDSNDFYLRARSSIFNNIWSIIHGKGVFLPDYIAAPIASDYKRCIITSYGIRWSWIVRNINIFPEILEVKRCDTIKS